MWCAIRRNGKGNFYNGKFQDDYIFFFEKLEEAVQWINNHKYYNLVEIKDKTIMAVQATNNQTVSVEYPFSSQTVHFSGNKI